MDIKTRKLIGISLVLLITINLLASVSAITASIGNGRMILRLEKGETIEKYIKVINNNNVSVNINLTASGDLADWIKIKDGAFTLQQGEEKKAYFEIKVKELGTTEGSIDVKFTPTDGKNGVGLSSTIIVIAKGEGEWEEEEIDEEEENTNEEDSGVNINTGNAIGNLSGINLNPGLLIILLMGIVLVLLIVLLALLARKKQRLIKLKKEVKRK